MSDRDFPESPDDEREVVLDEEEELEGPPPTIDPQEQIELDRDLDIEGFEQGIQG